MAFPSQWVREVRRSLALLAGLTGIVGGCTTSIDPTPVATLSVLPAVDSVEVGEVSTGFTLQMADKNGRIITGRRARWRSANAAVATVDSIGRVEGVSIGQTLITADVDGVAASATARVILQLSRIVLTPDSMDVPLTTSRPFMVELLGPGGEAIAGRTVTWASANPAVATVTASGVVNSVGMGSTTITARAGSKSATGRVRVIGEPVAFVRITPPAAVQVVRLGQSFQFSAACYNASSGIVPGQTASWSSSAPTIATVSATGLVTALAVGAAVISADCNGKTAQVTVQVTLVPVATVSVTPSSLTMFVGQLQQLAATAKDSAGNVLSLTNRAVIWTSDNLPVAAVSASGVATSFSAGTANVRVIVDDVPSGPVTVTVQNVPVATVQLQPNPAPNVKIGTPLQLTPFLRDANGNLLFNRTITWSSSDTAVATVSVNGLVSGVSAGGPVTITATCEGVSGTVQITIIP